MLIQLHLKFKELQKKILRGLEKKVTRVLGIKLFVDFL